MEILFAMISSNLFIVAYSIIRRAANLKEMEIGMKISEPNWTFYQSKDKTKVFMSFDCESGKIDEEYIDFIKETVNDLLLTHIADNSDYKSEQDSGMFVAVDISSFDSDDCGRIYATKEETEQFSIHGIEPHISRPIDIATEIIDYDYSLNELREIAEHLKAYCDCQESELPFEDVG